MRKLGIALLVVGSSISVLVANGSATLAVAPGVVARQTVALKALVPKGWLIGAAINQNQSDSRDAAAVDIVTAQFNTISPENLLKFQSVHPQPDQYTFGIDPIAWTSSERRIRCPEWDQARDDAHGDSSLRSSRKAPFGSCWTRARLWAPSPASSI